MFVIYYLVSDPHFVCACDSRSRRQFNSDPDLGQDPKHCTVPIQYDTRWPQGWEEAICNIMLNIGLVPFGECYSESLIKGPSKSSCLLPDDIDYRVSTGFSCCKKVLVSTYSVSSWNICYRIDQEYANRRHFCNISK
jgi:hypothetical protein